MYFPPIFPLLKTRPKDVAYVLMWSVDAGDNDGHQVVGGKHYSAACRLARSGSVDRSTRSVSQLPRLLGDRRAEDEAQHHALGSPPGVAPRQRCWHVGGR